MFISHRCRFIIFTDPADPLPWLDKALAPWTDECVSQSGTPTSTHKFFAGMTPDQVRAEFDSQGLDFESYTRIAVVQNPLRRIAAHYDRLVKTDPIWRIRLRAGLHVPDFRSWLLSGKFEANGILDRIFARGRKFASRLAAYTWRNGDIDEFVRVEYAASDLRAAFRKLAVVPAIDLSEGDKPHRFAEILRYDFETMELVQRRFRDDLQLYRGMGARLDLAA